MRFAWLGPLLLVSACNEAPDSELLVQVDTVAGIPLVTSFAPQGSTLR